MVGVLMAQYDRARRPGTLKRLLNRARSNPAIEQNRLIVSFQQERVSTATRSQ
jgi:tellurite resistance protein